MPDTSSPSERPAYRPYRASVADVTPLGPHFVRVGFTSPEFVHFGTGGLDQRIKIVFPGSSGAISDVGQDDPEAVAAGEWYTRWRALPNETRSPFRTYTVRRIDPAARRLEVDFVVHHDPGPAGAWADAAAPGDEVLIVGPDERSPGSRLGIDWHPGTARRVLLVGDETAAPAIASILEALPPSYDIDAIVEVPDAADVLEIRNDRARVTWLPRGEAAHGSLLVSTLEAWCEASMDVLTQAAAPRPQDIVESDDELVWDSPDDVQGDFYAWIAGEAGTVKTLRRMLVAHRGVDRKRVAFMGYWRRGVAEAVE